MRRDQALRHWPQRNLHTADTLLVLALFFVGFAALGFVLRHWLGLVLSPIVCSLFFLGPDLGWWGSESQEVAWVLLIPFIALSMLTMTVGILIGRTRRDAASRNRGATSKHS